MLGDKIVCVGSGITAADAEPVETILENHRLAGENAPALIVDGQPQSPATGPQTPLARWLYLDGNVPSSSLGCVFWHPSRYGRSSNRAPGRGGKSTKGATTRPSCGGS